MIKVYKAKVIYETIELDLKTKYKIGDRVLSKSTKKDFVITNITATINQNNKQIIFYESDIQNKYPEDDLIPNFDITVKKTITKVIEEVKPANYIISIYGLPKFHIGQDVFRNNTYTSSKITEIGYDKDYTQYCYKILGEWVSENCISAHSFESDRL